MKTTSKSGERTLLMSVVLSSPGPIVVGVGLFLGRSSTQLADFIRRTAELAAILVSYLIYRVLHKCGGSPEPMRRQSLERTANTCVGAAMCLSGAVMCGIAFLNGSSDKGNVMPGLCIAVLGVTTNTWFWLRYRILNREKRDVILEAQSNLYRAKSLVDTCVLAALLTVALVPGTSAAEIVDTWGSVIVAGYLFVNGIITIRRIGKNGRFIE